MSGKDDGGLQVQQRRLNRDHETKCPPAVTNVGKGGRRLLSIICTRSLPKGSPMVASAATTLADGGISHNHAGRFPGAYIGKRLADWMDADREESEDVSFGRTRSCPVEALPPLRQSGHCRLLPAVPIVVGGRFCCKLLANLFATKSLRLTFSHRPP
jgi:hypothetical protein